MLAESIANETLAEICLNVSVDEFLLDLKSESCQASSVLCAFLGTTFACTQVTSGQQNDLVVASHIANALYLVYSCRTRGSKVLGFCRRHASIDDE